MDQNEPFLPLSHFPKVFGHSYSILPPLSVKKEAGLPKLLPREAQRLEKELQEQRTDPAGVYLKAKADVSTHLATCSPIILSPSFSLFDAILNRKNREKKEKNYS